MLRRFICWLGYHDWHQIYSNTRGCYICGKKQGVYKEGEE